MFMTKMYELINRWHICKKYDDLIHVLSVLERNACFCKCFNAQQPNLCYVKNNSIYLQSRITTISSGQPEKASFLVTVCPKTVAPQTIEWSIWRRGSLVGCNVPPGKVLVLNYLSFDTIRSTGKILDLSSFLFCN